LADDPVEQFRVTGEREEHLAGSGGVQGAAPSGIRRHPQTVWRVASVQVEDGVLVEDAQQHRFGGLFGEPIQVRSRDPEQVDAVNHIRAQFVQGPAEAIQRGRRFAHNETPRF
jgi:hypothetical protein